MNHLKARPFDFWKQINHLKLGQVRYLNVHCTFIVKYFNKLATTLL
jgi:hypothetical protein